MVAVQCFLQLCALEMVFVAYPYCLSKRLLAKFPIVFLVAFTGFANSELQGFSERTLMGSSVFLGVYEMCFKGDSVFVLHVYLRFTHSSV